MAHTFKTDDGATIHYRDEGAGQPLVFIPGWTFATDSFARQFPHYAKNYRVISFDPRNHGQSSQTTEGNNYTTQAKDMAALLAHLKVEKPIIVGWSFGALTAWQFVQDAGTDAVAGVVIIDMPFTPMTDSSDGWVEAKPSDLAGMYQAIQTAQGFEQMILWYTDNVMIQGELTDAVKSFVLGQSLKCPPWAASLCLAAGAFSDYTEVAQKIDASVPSMFVVAEHWAEVARATLSKQTPKSRVEILGGHMMFWEHAEAFNALLDDFLTTHKL